MSEDAPTPASEPSPDAPVTQQPDAGKAPQAAAPIPAPAVAHEPAVYQRRRTLGIVALLLLGLGLIAFAVLGVRAFSSRMEAARKLDEATQLVQDADKLVVEVDDVVRAKVTPELAEKARGAQERVDGAERMLNQALELIDEADPDLNDDERERGALLRDTAEARLDMLDPAPVILKLNAEASSALPLSKAAWAATLEADTLSDKAVAAYNKLNKAGVAESQKLNKQAAGQLSVAREQFDAAEKAFSSAPFEKYLAYIDARVELNKLSQQSDDAWLKNDIAKANSLITTYNAQDQTAVGLAKQLPANPEAAIASAFESTTKVQTDAYYAAREAALEADQKLREY